MTHFGYEVGKVVFAIRDDEEGKYKKGNAFHIVACRMKDIDDRNGGLVYDLKNHNTHTNGLSNYELMSNFETHENQEERLAKLVSDGINNMSFNNDTFVKFFSGEHRTLQQSFTRLCYEWLCTLANSSFDSRNRASVMFAKGVINYVPDDLRYFPFI